MYWAVLVCPSIFSSVFQIAYFIKDAEVFIIWNWNFKILLFYLVNLMSPAYIVRIRYICILFEASKFEFSLIGIGIGLCSLNYFEDCALHSDSRSAVRDRYPV